jgi:DNA-directed RNA polymerase beta' subunit
MGLAIPPDLHDLASRDKQYQQKTIQKKMGFTAKNHKSSKLLERALKAGQKGKTGLGFKKPKKSKKGKRDKEKILDQMYGDNRSLNEQYRDMVNVLAAEEFKIKADELYGKDKVKFHTPFFP